MEPSANESEPSPKIAAAPEPDRNAAAASPPAPAAEDFRLESRSGLLGFLRVKSGCRGVCGLHLEKYPDGTFTALAETRRHRRLLARPSRRRQTRRPQPDAVELAYWDTMKDSDNPDMFRAYLERYPDGAFAPLAKVRLGELGAPST